MQHNVPDFSKLTWACHCCNKPRQDKFIKISTHDTSKLFGIDTGVMYLNVRYCSDTDDCKKKAFDREWVINRFFKDFMTNDCRINPNETANSHAE